MITFICSIVILLAGYFLYGKLMDKIFKPDDRPTPAIDHPDGVDYVPMKTWRVFLIQLLNIAGTGPIFGALMGAVFGPIVFLWIVFGSILGGAVHDYMSGMISLRLNGASVSEIVGKYLGSGAKQVMRVFSVILLILVGAVFTTSPAALLARLTPDWMNTTFWVVVILLYYFLATLLPIDKLIGKLYPIFGAVLAIMAVGIIGGLVVGGYSLPEISFSNLHPDGQPVWPFMFITVACGAISGFHATQSPMMARCLKKEKDGRKVFLRRYDRRERDSARLGGRGRSLLRRDRRTSKRAFGAGTVGRGIRHIRVSARYRGRSARYSGRRGLPDFLGRHRFQKRASDYRGLVQDRPVEYEKASCDHDTFAGRGRDLDPA